MKYKISSHIKELLSFRITKVALLLIIFAIAIQTDAKPALSPEKPAVTEWVQPIERPLHFELTNTGKAKGITLAPSTR